MVTFPNECPLGLYEVVGGTGRYSSDPVEACIHCDFVNPGLEMICQCPSNITPEGYSDLRKSYINMNPGQKLTKTGFQEFVQQQLKDSKPII